jgi:hypothetical protein
MNRPAAFSSIATANAAWARAPVYIDDLDDD